MFLGNPQQRHISLGAGAPLLALKPLSSRDHVSVLRAKRLRALLSKYDGFETRLLKHRTSAHAASFIALASGTPIEIVHQKGLRAGAKT